MGLRSRATGVARLGEKQLKHSRGMLAVNVERQAPNGERRKPVGPRTPPHETLFSFLANFYDNVK